jgi:hypothetical protein
MKSATTRKTAKKFPPLVTPELKARIDKMVDRIANPRPKAIEFPGMGPSIRQRIEKIHMLVTLIAAAAAGADEAISANDVLDAINEAANDAADELYWLGEGFMPPSIGNLPALTEDEYRNRGVDGSEDDERDDFMRARMRDMLDAVQR